MHIVGLGVDSDDERLRQGLAATRGGREARAREMAAELAKVGIAGAYEGALRYVGNPDLISRTHFARHLVDSGVCADTQEVFRRFLVDGKPGYVPHRWATLKNAVTWIGDAGGVAIVAHPARYKFSPTEEYALFTEFKGHGGRGVEVVTGSHTAAEAERYAGTAREFDLLASRGSDFHSPDESRIDLGGLPPLPATLAPVWEALAGAYPQAALRVARGADNRRMSQYFEVHPLNPQPRLLKQAAQILQAGGVAAIPTDSSYALACHLDDKARGRAAAPDPRRRRSPSPDAALPRPLRAGELRARRQPAVPAAQAGDARAVHLHPRGDQGSAAPRLASVAAHDRPARSRPSGDERAARPARPAAARDDADRARRERADERPGADPRALREVGAGDRRRRRLPDAADDGDRPERRRAGASSASAAAIRRCSA